ncbi:hypothetical protein [Rubripirellula reticaptiva]|nr:hypothetical protein [Rubripirellula reticaptiva]
MRLLTLALLTTFASLAFAGGRSDRVTIHLLDPRGAIDGDHTMPTEWKGGKTDVLGSRVLNISEAKALRTLLTKELADDDNVPFCGHSPAYAVTILPDGGTATTVTLCGTCGTWAKRGELRALHGKAALKMLDDLLPLPDVFQTLDGKPAKILDPFDDSPRVPFRFLAVPDGG